jgi:protein gp37
VSEGSAIEWTEATFNPWWGCARVSPACVNCYADTWARRTGRSDLWRRHGARRLFGEIHWQEPLKWNRKAEARGRPMLVFCASMADVFEDHPVLAPEREKLWALMERTPWLVWQLLTKRPENVPEMAPWGNTWPPNVWLGTSIENQRWADIRIQELLRAPATVEERADEQGQTLPARLTPESRRV